MTAVATARLDAELVRRGLARSRARAAALVDGGHVTVDGTPARKPAQPVAAAAQIVVAASDDDVSRGAQKLAGALDAVSALTPDVPGAAGARCLDAGASTGGFTQVLLRHGAAHVLAVDVGHGQLDPAVAADPRVTAVEGVNVRDLDLTVLAHSIGPDRAPDVGSPVDLVVADLSFISLRTVVEALVRATRAGGRLLLLVKPQFEVGRERLGRGGVVVSADLRVEAVVGVARALEALGVRLLAVVPSPVPGESGNRELFLWGVRSDPGTPPTPASPAPDLEVGVRRAVERAVPVLLAAGPDPTPGEGGGPS
ncbi:MAG: TlyA family RNA methyltransferase [Actinotalea sp.]|nr:TlyA family RNA methyltransferase [Actinotalea sp.]